MTTLIGDLQSIMGTPFGGEGHAVLIFSRVSRAAFQSDAVIIELHDRIPMPKEAEGKFEIDQLDPGPIRVELEGGTVHGHGWNVDLPEEGEWSLADLLDAQVEWSPAVVGRAESAARDAAYAQRQTEGLRAEVQGLRDETFDKADAALNDAANLVRGEFESLTERAETGASTATEQAGFARSDRVAAEDAADSAHGASGAAAEATKAEIRAEMDSKVSEAEGSAQSAGESARVAGEADVAAEGWAGQSKDAATLAITAAATTSQYVGDGFPEGRVTAPVGSVYTDRLATAGAVRWIKTQGDGNTGWVVTFGDTGWRDVTAHIPRAVLGGQMLVRRTTTMASIYFYNLLLEDSGFSYQDFGNFLPTGFYDPDVQWFYVGGLADRGANYTSGAVRVSRYGGLRVQDVGPGQYMTGMVSLTAGKTWPSTRTGTPA